MLLCLHCRLFKHRGLPLGVLDPLARNVEIFRLALNAYERLPHLHRSNSCGPASHVRVANRFRFRGVANAPFHEPYRLLCRVLFTLGVLGIFINRKNIIVILMAIELMLLAVNMNFVAFSHYLGDMHGQVFVFFILTVAAAESAIGLAILVLLFRNKTSIDAEDLNALKG